MQGKRVNRTDEALQKRLPIRRRVLAIVLLTTLLGILAATAVGIVCINWIRNSSETALIGQLEGNLKSVVQQKAVSADAKLEHYEKYIEFVTDYIEQMYANEADMIQRGRIFYPPPDTHEYMLTRGFANESLTEDQLRNEILLFSNLEHAWAPIAKENEDLITTVYAGTTNGLLSSYDRWSYLSAVPEGQEFYYDYFQADWYKQGMKEGGVFYTGLYVDSQGRGLTITVASPFRNAQGQIAGVDCADFDITGLYDELLSFDLGEGTFSFALDKNGAAIMPDERGQTVQERTGLTPDDVRALQASPDGILEKEGAVYVGVPIDRVGWMLCAGVPKEVIQGGVSEVDRAIRYALIIFVAVVVLIVALEVIAVNKVASNITHPMELLGRDMKIIADGDLNYRARVYRNDEIGDITSRMNEMVDRLNFTINELASTQQHADAMSRLATRDALTGIRNKTAYTEQEKILKRELAQGNREFGFAVVDLNNLKATNDRYGHDKGDVAITRLSRTVCNTFVHSPVFRVGGDEFVVVLMGDDYRNVAALVNQFNEVLQEQLKENGLSPWERTSAAIGYALYDEALDSGVEDVLVRADREMYKRKRSMKRA